MATRELLAHDKKLRAVFSLVGSHFVDIYFNHVYTSAQSHAQGGGSLPNEYARQLGTSTVGVKRDKRVYRAVVKNLHRYFQSFTQYEAVSFGDFVDAIITQLVPKEYYELLTADQKDEFLSSTICDLVAGLGAYMTTPDLLLRVIDHHDAEAQVTIGMAQKEATAILMRTRGETHNKFLRRAGQAKDTTPVGTVTKLIEQVRKLAHDKAHLIAKVRSLETTVADLEAEAAAQRAREQKYRKLLRLLQTERAQGLDAAVAQHAAPPARHRIAEVDPFAAQAAGPTPSFAGRNMIAEVPAHGGPAPPGGPARESERIGADFFAVAPPPPASGSRVGADFFTVAPQALPTPVAPPARAAADRPAKSGGKQRGEPRESRFRRGGLAGKSAPRESAGAGKNEPPEDEVRPESRAPAADTEGLGDFIELAGAGANAGTGDLLDGILDED